eukprot:6438796-Amphidinium_carterae.1
MHGGGSARRHASPHGLSLCPTPTFPMAFLPRLGQTPTKNPKISKERGFQFCFRAFHLESSPSFRLLLYSCASEDLAFLSVWPAHAALTVQVHSCRGMGNLNLQRTEREV